MRSWKDVMKRAAAVAYLTVAVVAVVHAQDVQAVEKELKQVEADLAAAENSSADLAALTQAVKNGKIIFVTFPGEKNAVPTDPDTLSQFLLMQYINGYITREHFNNVAKELPKYRRAAIASVNELTREYEANLAKLRDRRSFLINERIRLREKRVEGISGDWTWKCCDGVYSGTLTLKQSGSTLTGSFNGDPITAGTVNGSTVTFTRTFTYGVQTYSLTLSADGKTMTGRFEGFRNKAVGVDFKAERK